MMQMNDPVEQMRQLLQAGISPGQILAALAQNYPQAKQVMQMMNGKNPRQLEQFVRNMAKERGTTLEDVARSIGISIPSQR